MISAASGVGRALDHVRYLASAACAGRGPGTPGETAAAAYLERELSSLGAVPWREGCYADPFTVVVPCLAGAPRLRLCSPGAPVELEEFEDFTVNVQGAVGGGEVEAETCWIGGAVDAAAMPGSVEGRVAVAVALDRSDLTRALAAHLTRLEAVRAAGAVALLEVSRCVRRRKVMCHRRQAPGLPSLDVSPAVARLLFAVGPLYAGRCGATVKLAVPLEFPCVRSRGNLVARVGGADIGAVLVAHYDHLGAATGGRYFAGAADNAAGVAVTLEVARRWVAAGRDGGLLLLLTAAEEVGLVGSERFVAGAPSSLAGALVLNVDELGGSPAQLRFGATAALSAELAASDASGPSAAASLPLAKGFADHAPFISAGWQRVGALWSPAPEGIVHTLRDLPERLSPATLAAAAAWLEAVLVATQGPRAERARARALE